MHKIHTMQGEYKNILQEIFSRNLAKLQQELNLTQGELGAPIGISQGNISRYLSGDVMPEWDTLALFMKHYNKPASYFLSDGNTNELADGSIQVPKTVWEQIKKTLESQRKQMESNQKQMEADKMILVSLSSALNKQNTGNYR